MATVSRFNEVKDPMEPTPYDTQICRQVELLLTTSETERVKILDHEWVQKVESFYNLAKPADVQMPSFRPLIMIPELQFQMLSEASDLSDIQPRVYIVKHPSNERDKARETAIQAQWTTGDYNLEVLKAMIWSLFAGNGYIQVKLDPNANDGEGDVDVCARHPGTVFADPYAGRDKDLSWVVVEDDMYLDEVRYRFPEHGVRVRRRRPGVASTRRTQIRLLPGPMTATGLMPMANRNMSASMEPDPRVRVRTTWVRDYSIKKLVKEGKMKDPEKVLIRPSAVRRYPDWRQIVTCEGIVLYDGPAPLKRIPIITFFGTPPLTGHFCPPPISYTKDMQNLAERLYRQTYENAVRLNNGVTYIDENTNISDEDFGGLPAELHVIATGSRIPETKYPNAMPREMIELPKVLLDMQKEIQGFTPARRGMTSAGNVSAPLYDSSVLQAQSVTRLRGKFAAVSFQRLAEVVFEVMARFYTVNRAFPSFKDEEADPIEWDAITGFDPVDYKIRIDQASIRPYSAAALRSMIPVLKQLGIIDSRTALELLEIPGREEIEKRLDAEAKQKAALGQAAKASKGAGKPKK